MDILVEFFAVKYALPLEQARLMFALVSVFVTAATAVALPVLALVFYKHKRQHDHITFSVNELDEQNDGSTLLRIRTIQMLPKGDILTNNWYLSWKLRCARRCCRPDQPFMIMNKHDMDLVQPAIISVFSSIFGEGIMADLAGMPVEKHDFLLAMTYEVYENDAPYKYHVMVVRECDLEKFDDPEFCRSLQFERGHHVERVTTLKCMLQRWRWELAHTTVDQVRAVRKAQATFRV